MKILTWLLAASLALAACGPRQLNTSVATPQVSSESICMTGTEFTPGETIPLGETADFGAVLYTRDGSSEDDATLTVLLPDGEFSPSSSVLPKEGKTKELRWGEKNRVEVVVANCGGRYFFEATLYEVIKAERDQTCASGFGGPTKPWPFADQALLFRPGDGEEVWLFLGMGPPVLMRLNQDRLEGAPLAFERPLDGKTSAAAIRVSVGELIVTIKNCHETIYYAATWHWQAR